MCIVFFDQSLIVLSYPLPTNAFFPSPLTYMSVIHLLIGDSPYLVGVSCLSIGGGLFILVGAMH